MTTVLIAQLLAPPAEVVREAEEAITAATLDDQALPSTLGIGPNLDPLVANDSRDVPTGTKPAGMAPSSQFVTSSVSTASLNLKDGRMSDPFKGSEFKKRALVDLETLAGYIESTYELYRPMNGLLADMDTMQKMFWMGMRDRVDQNSLLLHKWTAITYVKP